MALTMVILFEHGGIFPSSFLFILARMQSIPRTFKVEAAETARRLRNSLVFVTFIAGILAVLFLLRFIWTFNKFDDIFLLTGGGNAGTG